MFFLGCTYCANGSFHPSSSPMIHQTIRADAPYLVHHSVPLQLPHDSSHPLPVQLSHSDRPPAPISHQVSQVTHGDMNSMHLSHVYGVPHNELSSATTVNTLVPVDQDFIDVGVDDLSDISHSTNDVNQRHSSSSDNMKKDNVKKDSAKLLKTSSKGVSNKENDVSSNKNGPKIKDSGTKSVKPKQKRLKSTEEQNEKIKAENKSDKTNLKRKRSDEDDKKDCTKGVKRPKIETEVQKASSDKQNVTTKLKDKSKEKAIAKQKDTDKQKTTAKPNNALKQTNTTQLKRLDTVNEKDLVKKAKSKEVKKEAKETKKEATEIKKKERKNSGGNKEKVQRSVSTHGWSWEGEPEVRTITGIVSFTKLSNSLNSEHCKQGQPISILILQAHYFCENKTFTKINCCQKCTFCHINIVLASVCKSLLTEINQRRYTWRQSCCDFIALKAIWA